MRWIALLFLLCVTSALATPLDDAEYITVVTDAGGPKDVITAASFAAYMSGLGFTFTGALDTTLPAVEGVEGKFLVLIEGQTITIMDGKGDTRAAAKTRDYFSEEGFTVDVGLVEDILPEPAEAPASGSDDAGTQPEEIPDPIVMPAEECEGCEYGSQCLAKGTIAAGQYCSPGFELLPLKATGEPCVYSYECWSRDCRGECHDKNATPPVPEPAEEDKPNVIVRVWRWFTGLFG